MSSFFQLTTEQLEATGTKLCTILCSVLFFSLLSTLTFLLSFRCSVVGCRKDLAKWCIAIPRFVFGVGVSTIGFYFVVIDDTLKKNIVYAKTPLSAMGLYFMEGYCIYEIIYCSLFKVIGSLIIWFHHITVLLAVSLAIYLEKGHFAVIGTGALDEIVIPFVIIRWMLLKTNSDKFYRKLNRILKVFFYHSRSLNEAYFFYLVSSQWNTAFSDLSLPLFYTAMICPLILLITLFIFTPYWTYLSYKDR